MTNSIVVRMPRRSDTWLGAEHDTRHNILCPSAIQHNAHRTGERVQGSPFPADGRLLVGCKFRNQVHVNDCPLFCTNYITIAIVRTIRHRDTIRQTWANTTEFNYSFFRKAHAKMRGQYLEINFPNWSNFTTNATTNIGHRASLDDDAMAANVGGQSPKPRQRADFSDFAVKVVFLVGQTPSNETQARIVTEAEQFGDLIQESFLDSYNNLTLKTIMMLKWVTANCGDRGAFAIISFYR